MYALRGEYRPWSGFERGDLDRFDHIVLNLNPEALSRYARILRDASSGRRAKVIGLYEGELTLLHRIWKEWGEAADLCDLVIGINAHGIGLLQSLTSSPVRYIGIPYPVDGVKGYHVPAPNRRREILLCAPLLSRPLDYLAARPLGLPMYGYETTFSRRPREILKHRTFNKLRYVHRAESRYADPGLSVLPGTHLAGFFARAAGSLFWMNLDPRYTWGRYVLDAAALGVPIITTRETGHGPRLFPSLTVETPYDIPGATRLGERLLEEPEFYAAAVRDAADGLDWYRPAPTVERLMEALGGAMVRPHL